MRGVRLIALLALLALVPAPLLAQVAGPPFVFTNGTVINADEVNANFAAIFAAALNRTGGTMTGPLLFSADNTQDIGQSGTARPRDLFLARNATIGGTLGVTGASTFTGTATFNGAIGANAPFTVTSTTSPQFLARYDASNRFELYVASNGALTLNAVGAGSAFAFSDAVTVNGGLTTTGDLNISGVNAILTSANPIVKWIESDAAANSQRFRAIVNGSGFNLQACNDAESVCGNAFAIANAAGTIAGVDFTPPIRAAAGTAALPSFTFSGDPDTGMYSGGANVIAWSTGGTLRASLSSSGYTLQSGVLSVGAGGYITPGDSTFAGLPAASDGAIVYCEDCTVANPCAGAGTGALAKRLAGAWRCN